MDGIIVINQESGWKVILPPELWATAMKHCHGSIWAGHLKVTSTLERIKRRYWWPGMREVVTAWVRSCQDCGSRKARPKDIIPPLRPIKAGAINERWAMDTITMPETKDGYKYAICFTEYVTRLAVVVKCKSRRSEEVAEALVEKVILVHGPFKELLCDGAKEFVSEVMRGVISQLQMHQNNPVPYKPNLMGLVERFNRTIKDMLAMYVNERQDDWDVFLPMLVYAYNTSVHGST